MSKVPKLWSAELDGIDAELIEVEADINVGLHSFSIVGLADKAVSEARERVNSALKHIGVKPPTRENRKITVNLAPADTKKVGSRFDLAIALAYLLASEQIKPFDTSRSLFIGELSLDGSLRGVHGALNAALLAKREGFTHLFIPEENAAEAAIIKELSIIPIRHLNQLIEHLEEINSIPEMPHIDFMPDFPSSAVMLQDIRGNAAAKRALTIAAAGNHHLLMTGPPGTGKSMLAQALNSLLPPTSLEECLEITQIWSAARMSHNQFYSFRPFRAPHHSASLVSLIGGGQTPRPGEVSLAHRGVLFLDELPEFHRDVVESLRQPLESGVVHVARAKKSLQFPSRFTLVAAMNPCPCGYFEDREHECKCSAYEILRYQKKISGPLLDRIDLHIEVPRVPIETLREKAPLSLTNERDKVLSARAIQRERFKNSPRPTWSNGEMTSKQVEDLVILAPDGEDFMKRVIERSFLSPRGYYRILKVARTIADIDESELIHLSHLAEAFQYKLKVQSS